MFFFVIVLVVPFTFMLLQQTAFLLSIEKKSPRSSRVHGAISSFDRLNDCSLPVL